MELTWRLRRALLILIYLALCPERRADKDRLVQAIWPADTDIAVIRRNFHPTLSDVRRALTGVKGSDGRRSSTPRADVLRYAHGVYGLNPEISWQVDIERFEQLIATGRELRDADPEAALDAWNVAWRLYRGPFLVGFEASWISRRRDELQRKYVELLTALGDLAAESGQTTTALDAYRSVLFEEPYEERVHMAVMELYGRQGRRDLVRRQFVRLQDLLKDQLDVEPMAETQSCYHRLMR